MINQEDIQRHQKYPFVLILFLHRLFCFKIKTASNVILKVCINDCRQYVITGPLIKHLIVRTFAGIDEKILKVNDKPPPEIESLVANPIKGLCWYLRNFLIGEGKIEVVSCEEIFGKTASKPPQTEEEQKAAAAKAKQQESLEQRINDLEKTCKSLQEQLKKKTS